MKTSKAILILLAVAGMAMPEIMPARAQVGVGFFRAKTAAGGGSYAPASDSATKEFLKADAISAVSDGVQFGTWTATVGNDATQANGANQPTFRTGQKNSKPIVDFVAGGTAPWMATASFGTIAQPFTIWVMGKFTDTGGYRGLIDGLSGANRVIFYIDGPSTKFGIHAGTDAVGQAADTNWHIFKLKFNGASSSITLDNGSPTTVNAGTGSFVGMTLGTFYDQTFRAFADLGEVIVQDSTETATDAQIYTYFYNRWHDGSDSWPSP